MTGEIRPRQPRPDDSDSRLVDTILALRDEVAGLREAGQLRAIIEQAKGVLMERDRISSEEAFARLRTISQEHNVRLVEVAATLVGVTVPASSLPLDRVDAVIRARLPDSVSASPAWREFQRLPEVSAGVVGGLLDVVASGTEHGEDAVTLLADLLRPFDVQAVALYRRLADESLSLVGSAGIPPDLISSWSRVPPARELPYVAAVLNRTPYFWGSTPERVADFPRVGGLSSFYEASAAIPVLEGSEAVGVVGLMWDGAQAFSQERTEAITDIIQRVSRIVLRTVESEEPELRWLGAILRLHLDPWILLEVVATADGRIRDFVVVDAAENAPEARQGLGQRMLAMWPVLAADGTLESLSGLAGAGGFWTTTVNNASDAPWGEVGSRLRATRLGRRLVVVWRDGQQS